MDIPACSQDPEVGRTLLKTATRRRPESKLKCARVQADGRRLCMVSDSSRKGQSNAYMRHGAQGRRSGKVSREPIRTPLGAESGAGPSGGGARSAQSGAIGHPWRSRTSDSSSGGSEGPAWRVERDADSRAEAAREDPAHEDPARERLGGHEWEEATAPGLRVTALRHFILKLWREVTVDLKNKM
ncbi:hypothetical protein HispidOSU_014382 [Sigmodon hispidus]